MRKRTQREAAEAFAADLRGRSRTTHGGGVTKKLSASTKVDKSTGKRVVYAKASTKLHQGKLERHQTLLIDKAEERARKEVLRNERAPAIRSAQGRWLEVVNWESKLESTAPWELCMDGHPPRALSVSRIARDGDGTYWVQGDILPNVKKALIVGAKISTNSLRCQRVSALRIGSR